MAKRVRPGPGGEHRSPGESKKRKFLRLVLLLTVKKYGLWIILNLYLTSLVGAGLGAMNDIWTEFQKYQSCQEVYLTNVAGTVSGSYNEAAHSLARSTVGKARCIATSFDFCEAAAGSLKGVAGLTRDAVSSVSNLVGGRRLSANCAPDSFMKPVFGWTAPGKIKFPEVNMNITSNTQQVVEKVKEDITVFEDVAKWARYAGWILAGVSVLFIILTALYYTVSGKPWKPSRSSYVMHAITFLRAAGAYFLALLVILLQAYSTDMFCNVSIQSISMDAPVCKVNDDCDFDCKFDTLLFPNTCQKCDIKLHWWWVEPFALPNVLAVIYLIFHFFVLVWEMVESRMEKKDVCVKECEERVASKLEGKARKGKGRKEAVHLVGDGVKDSSENVVDGPADVEEGVSTDEWQPQTRYECAIYSYPEKIYTGGLR